MKKNLLNRCLALILAIALCVPTLAVAANAEGASLYDDVQENSWYYPHVSFVTREGLMMGDGDRLFRPEDKLTRAELTMILYRLAGEPKAVFSAVFNDVLETDWFAVPVAWAQEAGVVYGDENGNFLPNDPISRQDEVLMMYRFAAMNGYDTSVRGNLADFSDAGELSDYAGESMSWAVGTGIIHGSDGLLIPQDNMTRAEVATVIQNYIENMTGSREEPGNTPPAGDSKPNDPTDPEEPPEEEDPKEITGREALENAVVETAWAYFFKNQQVQYDSATLTAVTDKNRGAYRVTEEQAPEYATSDTTLFSVCSYFCYDSYFDALGGYRVGNATTIADARTTQLWTSVNDESVIFRWCSDGSMDKVNADFDTPKELADWLGENWEELLRPGDWVIAITEVSNSGHATMYVGEGMMLECYGAKYSAATGQDSAEALGAIRLNAFDHYYTTSGISTYLGSGTYSKLLILRPINLLVDENDDILEGVKISASALSRQEYPGLEIDRTVNITPYGTAVAGGELTYSIKITNHSNSTYTKGVNVSAKGVAVNYQNWYRVYNGLESYSGTAYAALPVTEIIPAGTQFISATGSYTESNGTISWEIDLPAGESVTLSYTVKVTAQIGDMIESTGGSVANIPMNTIKNRVGGAKIANTENISKYLQYAAQYAQTVNGDVANGIYSSVFGLTLDLPDIQTIAKSLFEKDAKEDMLALKNGTELVNKMLVNKFFGGYRVHTVQANNERIWEYDQRYFEVGDILIKGVLSNVSTVSVASARVFVYLGNGYFAYIDEDGAAAASNSAQLYVDVFKRSYDFFVLLRPSQAYGDINTALTSGQVFEPDESMISPDADDTPADPGSEEEWQKALVETAKAYARKTQYAVHSNTALTKLGKQGALAATWNIAPEEISQAQPYYGTGEYLIFEVYLDALGIRLAEDQNGMSDLTGLTAAYGVSGEPQIGDIVVVDNSRLALYLGDNNYLTMSDQQSPISIGALAGSVTAVLRPLDTAEAHLTANGAGRIAFPGLEVTISSTAGTKYTTVQEGTQVTYTIQVKNHGDTAYTGLEIIQFVPKKGTLTGHTETGANFDSFTESNRMLKWTADVEPSGSVTVTYTVTVGEVGSDALAYYLTASGKVGADGKYVKLDTVSNRIGYRSLDAKQRALLLSLTTENISSLGDIKAAIAGLRNTYSALEPHNASALGSIPSFTTVSDYKDGSGKGILLKVKDEDSEAFGLLELIAMEDESGSSGVFLVEDFLGGEYVAGSPKTDRRILEPSLALLDAGDIILTLYGTAADGTCSVNIWMYAGFDESDGTYHVISYTGSVTVTNYKDPKEFFNGLDLLHEYDESRSSEMRQLAFVVLRPSQVADIGNPDEEEGGGDSSDETGEVKVTVTSSAGAFKNVKTGDDITYTITVTNTGSGVLNDITVSAVVAGGDVTGDNTLSWTINSLSSGKSQTYTVTVQVTAEMTESVSVVAKVSVDGEETAKGAQNFVAYGLNEEQKAALLEYKTATSAIGNVRSVYQDVLNVPEKKAASTDSYTNMIPSQSSYIKDSTTGLAFKPSDIDGTKWVKDTAPTKDKELNAKRLNIIVAYGGTEVLPMEEDPEYIRTDELRFEFLEPGDYITAQTNTTPFWVYLGESDGKYLFSTSTGVVSYTSDQASELLDAAKTKWFFVLRPGNQYKLNND